MSNKNRLNAFWVYVFFLIVLFSCQNNPYGPWQKYYLSPKLSNDRLIYLYEGQIDGKPTKKFVVQQLNKDTLNIEYYTPEGIAEQRIQENIYPDGAQLIRYSLYEDKKVTVANILHPNSFSFYPIDTNQYTSTALQWTSPTDSSLNLVTKKRRYIKDTIIEYKGNKKPALIFETVEKIENTKGNTFVYEATGREIYAKDIGLVFEMKHIERLYRLHFTLKSILFPDEVDGEVFD